MIERPVRWRRDGASDETPGGGEDLSHRQRLQRAMPDLQRCYERERRQVPGLRCRFDLELTIAPNGRVERVTASGTSQCAALARCAERVMAGITFDPPEEGSLRLTLPINFDPGG